MDSRELAMIAAQVGELGGSTSYSFTSLSRDGGGITNIAIPFNQLENLSNALDFEGKSHSRIKPIAIAGIRTFNDRAVTVYFTDGTFTKCVCGKDEPFSLYTGIAFCLFKRFLDKDNGHKMFNDLMREAFKVLDQQKKYSERHAEEVRIMEKRKQKALKRKQARKLKKQLELSNAVSEGLLKYGDLMAKRVSNDEEQKMDKEDK